MRQGSGAYRKYLVHRHAKDVCDWHAVDVYLLLGLVRVLNVVLLR